MSPRWPRDRLTVASRHWIRLIAGFVPAGSRREWVEEWEAELWQLRERRSGGGQLVLFLLGASWHGLWEWKEGWRMESIVQDVRYAVRTLARSPGFTIAAVLILGLSIGATTALFSVLEEAVLARPPYPEPERLVTVDLLFGMDGSEKRPNQWSYPRFRGLRDEVDALEDYAGYSLRSATLTDPGDPRVISVEAVSPGIFPLLGFRSARGRVFDDREMDRGDPVLSAVVTRAFWENDLGGGPDAVGRLITLDGSRFRIVGVVAGDFRGVTGAADLWIPLSSLRAVENDGMIDDPWNLNFRVLARLAPDATVEQARAEVQAYGATQKERFPAPVGAQRLEIGADVVPLTEARVNPDTRASMIALFGAVALVLLIATANLAGLMLARGAGRRQEAAIRASLGAGRTRLMRQLLTESLTLSLIGGALGIALAWVGVDAIASRLSQALGTGSSRGLLYLDVASISVDWGVLAFATLVTAGVGVGLGLLPALQVARTNPHTALKGGDEGGGLLQRIQGAAGRNAMLVVQIAVTLVLLVGASLMMRSMAALQNVELGFDPHGLLTAVYSITPADEDAGLDPGVLHVDFADRVRAIPGVTGVALGTVPMGGPNWTTIVSESDGDPELTAAAHTWMQLQPVDAEHLEVIGATLVEGRDIESADDWNSDRVIILNRSAVERLFPDGNPLGRRIRFGWSGYGSPGATVVGVVEDIQLNAPDADIPLQGFVSVRQAPQLESGLMVRTEGDPTELVPSIRAALAEIAPSVPLTSIMTMQDRASGLTARSRVVTMILGLFGVVALVLVAVGLYGMIAFTVTRRTRELGLRASLGADRPTLARLVLRQGLTVTLAGIAVGVGVSLYATRFLQDLLFRTEPIDPLAIAGMAGVLFLIGMAASYVPARRAMRIDPMEALRAD